MDRDLMRRIEDQIDKLLHRYREMEEELALVRAEKASLEADRERIRAELDRILGKFDMIERKVP